MFAADYNQTENFGVKSPGDKVGFTATPPGKVISGKVTDRGSFIWTGSLAKWAGIIPDDFSGIHHGIIQGEYTPEGKEGKPKIYTWQVDTKALLPKVKIEPFTTECIESTDSEEYKVTTTLEVKPDSYKWLIDGAFPQNAIFPDYKRQDKSKLEYSTPDKQITKIKEVRWFAPKGSRLASVDGPLVAYSINCELVFNGEKIKARDEDIGNLVVFADIEGMTIMEAFSGSPKMLRQPRGKWILIKMISKERVRK